MNNCEKAIYGESHVYQCLIDAGIDVEWSALSNRHSREDFIANGAMVDVKFSKKHGRRYTFNCHHHAKKQEGIDFYICVINPENVFVFPNELIDGKVLTISQKQVERGRYEYFNKNWGLIKNFVKK